MSTDPADLANLHDIALPPRVLWWPPTPGWWILAAGVLTVALLLLAEAGRRYRRNAYRRAARHALRALAIAPPPGSAGGVAPEIADIVKRAALVAYPRQQVAGLSGQAWAAFLARTGDFPPDAAASLGRAVLDASRPLTAPEAEAVLTAADQWTRRHRRAAA